MLAAYSFGDVMWTMFVFFAWIIFFWLLFTVFGDLFSRHRLAPTFSNSDVAPLSRFPYNYYDVLDPNAWTPLTLT